MKGIFVTGTDTGVGKTYVACAIASTLRRRGLRVGVLKPIETGCGTTGTGPLPLPADALALAAAAGDCDPIETLAPFVFAEPLAPWLAAEQEGRQIRAETILETLASKLSRFDFVIVEGAGGLLVPIARDLFVLDLVSQMALPLLIVAANRLGALSHTLLTVRAADRAAVPVAGVCLSEPLPDPSPACSLNAVALDRLLGALFLGTLHHRPDGRAPEAPQWLLEPVLQAAAVPSRGSDLLYRGGPIG